MIPFFRKSSRKPSRQVKVIKAVNGGSKGHKQEREKKALWESQTGVTAAAMDGSCKGIINRRRNADDFWGAIDESEFDKQSPTSCPINNKRGSSRRSYSSSMSSSGRRRMDDSSSSSHQHRRGGGGGVCKSARQPSSSSVTSNTSEDCSQESWTNNRTGGAGAGIEELPEHDAVLATSSRSSRLLADEEIIVLPRQSNTTPPLRPSSYCGARNRTSCFYGQTFEVQAVPPTMSTSTKRDFSKTKRRSIFGSFTRKSTAAA